MIKRNDLVKVVYSKRLFDEGLVRLVSRTGKVVDTKGGNKSRAGAWVRFSDSVTGESEEWFIPVESLRSRCDLDAIKNMKAISKINVQ